MVEIGLEVVAGRNLAEGESKRVGVARRQVVAVGTVLEVVARRQVVEVNRLEEEVEIGLEVVTGRKLAEGESKLVGVARRQVVEVGRGLAVGD